MAGFNFREFGDLLSGLRRDVEMLKRKAAGGVVTDIEIPLRPTGSDNLLVFQGPNGGMTGFMYRHGQFAHIQVLGVVANTNGASGQFEAKLPFVVATPQAWPVGYPLVEGGWSAYVAGGNWGGEVFALPGGSTAIFAASAVVTMTSPGTWVAGDTFRFFINCPIAPGS